MDLFVVNARPFRVKFYQTVSLILLSVAGGFLVIMLRWVYPLPAFSGKSISLPFLLLLVVASLFYSWHRKEQLEQVIDQENFEVQISRYKKLYQTTMGWHLFSALASCLFALLSYRTNFLLYGLIDLVIMLQFYPGQRLFRRELRNEEIVVSI
jgi:hypothetical protein